MTPGKMIRSRRSELGFTLKDLAEKTGLSQMYLSEIERGIKTPKKGSVISNIAESLSMDYPKLRKSVVEEIMEQFEEK